MFKIFPSTVTPDGRKVPLIKGWQEQASNDPEQIRRWQELYRDRITHWAVPTGKINDLLVLDVDVKTNGWKTIQESNLVIPETMSQKTMNGGSHFFFKYPRDGKEHGNRVGFLPGLDIRCDGGYVFFYGTDLKPIVDAPTWVVQDSIKAAPQAQGPVIRVSPEIADAIIRESLEAIRNAPQGESNNVLNLEAFRVGQLVASQSITREYAEKVLFDAALQRGKPPYEARATIASGLDGGSKKPLISPFPETPPQIAITIPMPPPPPARWTPVRLTRDDLLNTFYLKKPQLFQDWSAEDITITTAEGGTGKTTLKLYEAICLALGERFLGFHCHQRGKTLFVTGEDTDKKLAAMLGQIIRQMGLFEDIPGNAEKVQTILDSIFIKKEADLCLITKDKLGFLHMNADAYRRVSEAVQDIKPKLIVFDPISSFWGSESALNDMNKAVIKFMSMLVDESGACVEMINHIGKASSASKDMSQFSGRGGSGLPSHARISRALRPLDDNEYSDFTGENLTDNQSAMLCNVNKFSDGSPLCGKPFVILRTGYLFTRKTVMPAKIKELEESVSDSERIFNFVKAERAKNKYPTKNVIVAQLGIPIARVSTALANLNYEGFMGQKVFGIDNPDQSSKEKAYILTDLSGNEIT